MNVSREQEIKNVINHIEEAVWNGRHNDSKGYVVDLSNTTNKIEIWADIIEPVHESFSTEAYFKIGDKPSNVEDVIKIIQIWINLIYLILLNLKIYLNYQKKHKKCLLIIC